MKPHPWSELVERYSRFEERFEGGVPPPATDGAIQAMLQSAQNDDLVVPDDYVEYLKMRNGASFSGLMLYAADIAESDSYHRLDLVVMNQYQFNRGTATVLGTSDIDTYVVVGPEGPYRRLDRASWDTIDEFRTCDELLVSIFAAQTEALERAG
jgi:hypothetical protein